MFVTYIHTVKSTGTGGGHYIVYNNSGAKTMDYMYIYSFRDLWKQRAGFPYLLRKYDSRTITNTTTTPSTVIA